ncbi:phosphoribosylamine--glycine ligase [Pseudorhodoferax sp. Leaf274]|uniref:phosphoribosylamine--glycine ligase n=1 Tax=Pseudorhodoferax sp. Leaf274 TaxID=1736318 RepID=UPI0007034879|nr:phosphoribosylamine--glycine ligase [Pseudorhodoferax sp. Leaf274]KQP35348.1 phosphoribosylamine--glycine ligase [Pseudorhodoferax sp. Leaf274]
MKVLVIGGGGREHALAWKLAQSPRVTRVYVAPGNGGTALDERLVNVPITDVVALREWAQKEHIALSVVGPEGPLAAGVVDEFRAHGLRVFGPTKAAAQLESSKAFSKAFMQRHGIPTAEYQTFSDPAQAHAYVDAKGAPIVVKADGLAAGKGVVVATTLAEAHEAIDFMLVDNTLGVAHNEGGARVVIEEFLSGEEASFIVLCDGKNVTAMATSQDHKRLQDGDQGPNTGGMGAYSPAPVVTADVHARAMREIILPTIRGMEKDGIAYTGFLYAGLMIDAQGRPKTLEFNCRLGDPETQPLLMRLKSDLFEVLWAATEPGPHGKLDQVELEWDRRIALGVVLAAHGYPLSPRKGDAITGLPAAEPDAVVFHAGTQRDADGTVRVSGGRVLCVTVLADKVKLAQQRAYEVVRGIQFDGMQYRRDIGHRAVR